MAARLDGQVGIVTGSASGIGRECAIALALEGASVVVADVDVEGAKSVSDHIIARGYPAAHAVHVDLGDPASVESLIQQTLDRFGRLDILHNNAAATHLAATRDLNVLDMDPEVWDATMRINLKGTMLATKFALPHMIAAGRGSIVNTSSGASLGGDWGTPPTGSPKRRSMPSPDTRRRSTAKPAFAVMPLHPASSSRRHRRTTTQDRTAR